MDLTESARLLGNFGEFLSAIHKSLRNRGAVPMTLVRLMTVCAAFAVVGCSQEKPASQAELLDAVFEKWDTDNSPGCSVAAMRDGQIVHKGSYGMANLDHGVEIENATVFHVASVSKQFTAAAVVLLAQEGKLSLDDEVRDHVSELPDFGHKITIRHLIHHTSGLRDQWGLLSMTGWRYSEDLITNEDVLAVISRQRNLNFGAWLGRSAFGARCAPGDGGFREGCGRRPPGLRWPLPRAFPGLPTGPVFPGIR